MKNDWKKKLTAFDKDLLRMVESLTGMECVPKNGGDHYFFEANYEKHNDAQYILAIWDAIEGRAGDRLFDLRDNPERKALLAHVRFSQDRSVAGWAFEAAKERNEECETSKI